MKKIMCGLGLSAIFCTSAVEAASVEIRASFTPDSAQPNKNVFTNKTPNSGYCTLDPAVCTQQNIFSIEVPVRFTSSRPLIPGDIVSVIAPANWRRLTVINSETQESEEVEIRIVGMGSDLQMSAPVTDLTQEPNVLKAHQKLWRTSSWVYATPPCIYSGVGYYTPSTYRFFWKTPSEQECVKQPAYGIPRLSSNNIDFAYELRTPNPLRMSSGSYTGSMMYGIGPSAGSGSFYLGPLMIPDDDSLTLNFVLDVQHTLKVDIPPGGEKIMLEPAGGWQQWIQSGRKPTRLYRDQTFLISASSKFKMRIECEVSLPRGCGIKDDPTGYAGLVNVSVSLPDGLTDGAGNPVKKYPLSQSDSIAFQPGIYVDRKPGTLHFGVPEGDVSWLILNNKGRPYRGVISVIWDSEV